ncbi:MAG: CBASS cGAMP-activated phospholipase [Gammaproteobacteria bacterium]|nr:CBASS cGAMP-activated phospholipase [Gammaproteobacteria bacterium]
MNAATTNSDARRFQVLSLDGGGIKGIFSAAVLAAIEEDLETKITDHFDLIAGTSTGGVIAIGLGLGIRPREIVELYMQEGPKIFPCQCGTKSLQHWVARKFSAAPFDAALKKCFQDKRLGDSAKRLLIPAYNLSNDDIYLFRTAHHQKLRRDYKTAAWEVAKATSAAPTFFPCAREIDNLRLIDGGVWANNPSLVAVVEAYRTMNIPLSSIYLLSIGTLDAVNRRRKYLNNGGKIAWSLGNTAVDVIMRGQSIGATNHCKILLGQNHVERLDPKVAPEEFSLDGIHKADDLFAKASSYSRNFAPVFLKEFTSHQAPEFNPFYRL